MTHRGIDVEDHRDHEGAGVRHLPIPVRAPGGTAPAAAGGVLEPAGTKTVASTETPIVPTPVIAVAGGFLAGLATWALSRLLRPRAKRLSIRRASRRERPLQIAGTRSFLIDVHLIRR